MASAHEYRERELKFDVSQDWAMPDPAKLVPKGGRVEIAVVRLKTTYFDTVDRHLQRSRLTLRRRTGDIDVGWQLKVPDGDARIEIRAPLEGSGVPAELREATLGVRGRAALRPIATLHTNRTIYRILDPQESESAELVVDDVVASPQGEDAAQAWREVEVELLAGDEDLLAKASRWLRRHGAVPSSSESKLDRALGRPPAAGAAPDGLSGLICAYLDAQVEVIVRGDIRIRRGDDAVRPTRLATRRIRSVLRVFADVLAADRAAALDVDLKWFAAALGEIRDRHMLRRHLDRALDDLSPDMLGNDVGDVGKRIHDILEGEQAQAESDLVRMMRSRRYYALLDELRRWHRNVPVSKAKPAGKVERYLSRAESKMRSRLRDVPPHDGVEEAMHRARKAAKRTRYVAELGEPELGKRARSARRRAKKVQRRLGKRQDSVVAASFLHRAADAAHELGESAFALGVLYEQERRRVANRA